MDTQENYSGKLLAKGTLFVISAPSGAGKTSLVKALLETMEDVVVSVSHTTRQLRDGEVDGINYHFTSKEDFARMKGNSEFLEYAEVFGNDYGTSRQHLQEQLLQGKDVILEIDWQGARQIRQLIADCKTIYVLPPTIEELRSRLVNRGQDDSEVIDRRMSDAVSEMSHYAEFDYIVVNNEFEQARNDIMSILVSNRMNKDTQQQKHAALIAELLNK